MYTFRAAYGKAIFKSTSHVLKIYMWFRNEKNKLRRRKTSSLDYKNLWQKFRIWYRLSWVEYSATVHSFKSMSKVQENVYGIHSENKENTPSSPAGHSGFFSTQGMKCWLAAQSPQRDIGQLMHKEPAGWTEPFLYCFLLPGVHLNPALKSWWGQVASLHSPFLAALWCLQRHPHNLHSSHP